jgi:hypothetical protein
MYVSLPSRRALVCLVATPFLFACSSGPAPATSPPATSPPASSDFVSQFDDVWSRYDATYPYFVYKRVNWDSLRLAYRPRAVAATSQEALVSVIHEMLGQLRDVHSWLVAPNGDSYLATYTPTAFVNWRSDVWQKYMARYGWQQRSNWGYGLIEGIPYIAFGSWNPAQLSAGAVDAALEQFKDAPALVIDVRMNGGGNTALADSVAARFFDASRIATYVQYRSGPSHSDLGPTQASRVSPRGSWQFRKPVLLLVGRGCFSSNEDFIAAMSQLPNVTVVGDTTGGGSGNPAMYDLGGGWQYSVPRWIEYTSAMQVVEWKGIAPTVVVHATTADFDTGIDPVLEYAAQWAREPLALQNRSPTAKGLLSPL